ncbi:MULTISPECIES: hypothetical protein [Prochlorococcus]|uniref:Uncharacterized protein n=1 Tax=Prochlorococcus marinus str. MIT 9116 TaxID=167544 RepID=A0A0A1ZWZ7_PROMR|nr:hypothetical protein [Prochlorococcus marinus]KGF91984.1 hypothetical protein EU92_0283 [Prochlorococcus marinus str. MIT 9107]KGF93071.1 hypothetical protein EU93_0246 [Prochlorococcus marinus str. MIT 9116]KGF93970.1 hypothetical protein EU94_0876 [Prochlorococcus marinus str. MIT 9123]
MKNENNKSLIIYELNEIPKKVLEHYIYKYPRSNLAKLCRKDGYSETFTSDAGELHPWSSWPTFHRGVNSQKHKIKFLNQDISKATKFPPIWQKLKEEGFSIGIFGSLQSFPPLKGKNVKFFLPDTFAPYPNAYPKYLEDFQTFNLALTMRNKAHTRGIEYRDIRKFLKLILNGMFSIQTLYKIFSHVFLEILNTKFKSRRSLIQPILGFDVYFKLLKKHKPQFSTFFSNHVAGIMHRYWKDSFPEDFKENKNKYLRDSFNAASLDIALNIADYQIGLLLDFQNNRGGKIWVVSALGQKAINWGEYIPEITLDSEDDLLNLMGLEKTNYKFVPSMHPDINVECKNKLALKNLRSSFASLTDLDDCKLFIERYEPVNNTINFTLNSSKVLSKTNKLKYNNITYGLSNFGFSFVERDLGTGYHFPKGIFISNDPYDIKIYNEKSNGCIDTTSFYCHILNYFKDNNLSTINNK